MSEILLIQERVRNTIQLGESHFREFKSAFEGAANSKSPRPVSLIREDIVRTLVAFANADGGELLIGVEDDGTISGVPHSDDEIQKMFKAPSELTPIGSKLPSLLQYATKLELENKVVIFFSISKGTEEIYCTSSGTYYRRKDAESQPLIDFKQVNFERAEIKSREYDREFVDGASINDLDLEWIWPLARTMTKRISAKPSSGDLAEPNVERYLQQMGLAEFTAVGGLRLRRASLILFAKDPFRWHLRSEVRIMRVTGTERKSGERYNVISDVFVTGNIFKLLVDAWKDLKSQMVATTEFGPDARFEQKYIYPELTCREALINAIVHRDYVIQNPIEISLFDDRMEVKSPGALLSTITLENLEQLQGAHESRNALVARVLRENGDVRELGEGMQRMFEVMEEHELGTPKLYSNHYSFSITLFHKSLFNEKQKEFLANFSLLPLTPRQKKIIVLGMDDQEISPNDIYKAINTRDSVTYSNEVSGLRNSEVLVEIRTNQQASNHEKNNNLKRGSVTRFKVKLPAIQTRAPIKRSVQDYRVFVQNLPNSITEKELRDVFEKQISDVLGVYLAPKDIRPGVVRRGEVRFQSEESVKIAIQNLNGTEIGGNQIVVEEYKENS